MKSAGLIRGRTQLGALPAAAPCSLANALSMCLYPLNTKSFLFFSDSYSDSHFFFRTGWILLRKLKNRFEVSSFGLFCVEMGGRFSNHGLVWISISYPRGWCGYSILKDRLRSQVLFLADFYGSDTHHLLWIITTWGQNDMTFDLVPCLYTDVRYDLIKWCPCWQSF